MRRGTTTTRTPTARRPDRKRRPASAFCATSAAGTSRSSPIWWPSSKSIPEGDGTLLDHTCLVFVHEHAEANIHKASGMIALVAGSKDRLAHGRHTRVMGNFGDLYRTLADGVLDAGLGCRCVPDFQQADDGAISL